MEKLIKVKSEIWETLKKMSDKTNIPMGQIVGELLNNQKGTGFNPSKVVTMDSEELCSNCQDKLKNKLLKDIKVDFTGKEDPDNKNLGWKLLGLLMLVYFASAQNIQTKNTGIPQRTVNIPV